MKNTLFDEISKATRGYRKSGFKGPKLDVFKLVDVSSFKPKNSLLNLSSFAKVWNGALFIGLVLFVFLVFLGRSFKLQVIEGADNLVLADGNRIRVINAQAERGLVLDRDGGVLVRNKPAFSLEMNTEVCLVSNSCQMELNIFLSRVIIDVDMERIKKDLALGKPNIVIASGISKEELIAIESRLGSFPNISIGISPKRDYLYGDAFAHLIGYIGFGDTLYPTVEGKAGVEDFYDDAIKGISGGEIVQVDSTGRKINVLSRKKTCSG